MAIVNWTSILFEVETVHHFIWQLAETATIIDHMETFSVETVCIRHKGASSNCQIMKKWCLACFIQQALCTVFLDKILIIFFCIFITTLQNHIIINAERERSQ